MPSAPPSNSNWSAQGASRVFLALIALHLLTLNSWGLSLANGSKAALTLICLLGGLTLCLRKPAEAAGRSDLRWAWIAALLFLIPFLTASVPYGFNRLNQQGIEKLLAVFALPFFLVWMRTAELRADQLKPLLAASSVLIGAYAVWDVLTYPATELLLHDSVRLGGAYQQQSAYAGLTLLFALYCLLMVMQPNLNRLIKALAVVGMAGSLYACLMSGARGALLFLPLGLILAVCYASKVKRLEQGLSMQSKRGVDSAAPDKAGRYWVGFAILLLTAVALSWDTLQARYEMTVLEFSRLDFNDETFNRSSLGARLNLAVIAWNEFLASPWLGLGPGQFPLGIESAVSQNPALGQFASLELFHAHNQYLHDLAERGLPGLLSLLFFLGCLVHQFGKRFKLAFNQDAALFAMMGLMTAWGYVVFCLSNNFISSSRTGFFLILMTAICWVLSDLKQQESARSG